jgi:hypothetical protein
MAKLCKPHEEIMNGVFLSTIGSYDFFSTDDVLQLLQHYKVVDEAVLKSDFTKLVSFLLQGRPAFSCKFMSENVNQLMKLDEFKNSFGTYLEKIKAPFTIRLQELQSTSGFKVTGDHVIASMLVDAVLNVDVGVQGPEADFEADKFLARKGFNASRFDPIPQGFALTFSKEQFHVNEPLITLVLQDFVSGNPRDYAELLSSSFAEVVFHRKAEFSRRKALAGYVCAKLCFDQHPRQRTL